MPAPDEKKIDDPRSTKLPPVNRGPEPNVAPRGLLSTAGVSLKLKIFVIGLTVITIAVFSVFAVMFIKKMFVIQTDNVTWGPQLVTIAEELKNRGLKPQAIEHYRKYLDSQEVDLQTRSRVSFEIATLYVELGKCDDAVVWFLHAKAAQPAASGVQESENQLQLCRSRTKTSE